MKEAPYNPLTTNVAGPRILACASQGTGGDDEARLRMLLSRFVVVFLPFSRNQRIKSFKICFRTIRAGAYDLLVLEGTGVSAGCAAILGSLLFRRPFVLSSGDAVGPFLSARFPLGKPMFLLYERLLYTCSSGFIGWTPYLVGRALTMGAHRAITCPGWATYRMTQEELSQARQEVRAAFGIPQKAVVFGIAGSLTWSDRYQYCYGLELIRALDRSKSGAFVLIVGDGDGLRHLRDAAASLSGNNVIFTGRVPRQEVPKYLAAMDFGSLPQSVDLVGGFRYTTKLSEYRSVNLPFITNLNPVGYDLDRGDTWRLPGASPWDAEFLDELSRLMASVTVEDIAVSRSCPNCDLLFDIEAQVHRATAFLQDVFRATTKSQLRREK